MICQPTTRLVFTFPHTEVKKHSAFLGETYIQHIEFPAALSLIDRDHCYKSVSIQIPNDAGLSPIPQTGRKGILYWG